MSYIVVYEKEGVKVLHYPPWVSQDAWVHVCWVCLGLGVSGLNLIFEVIKKFKFECIAATSISAFCPVYIIHLDDTARCLTLLV